MNLIEELSSLCQSFEESGIEYALCGGLAMAVYAFPRSTMDIDLMIEESNLDQAKGVAKKCGFNLDIGYMEFANDNIRIYRLTKVSTESLDPLPLDLLVVTPLIKEVWNDRQCVTWEKGKLSVISPRGLIQLKEIRRSGQDLDDIKHLKELNDEG